MNDGKSVILSSLAKANELKELRVPWGPSLYSYKTDILCFCAYTYYGPDGQYQEKVVARLLFHKPRRMSFLPPGSGVVEFALAPEQTAEARDPADEDREDYCIVLTHAVRSERVSCIVCQGVTFHPVADFYPLERLP